MATHNLDLIRRTDYRTIELNHGRIVFDSVESNAAAAAAPPALGERA